ncbi:MAG: DUF1643 domain-containing protein [Fusobacteriaceae bacterium]
MIEKKSVMKTEVKMADTGSFRYLLSKEWNNKKKRAMVIMVHPSSADDISIDFTTLYTLNNLQKLDYGAVDIVNIYPNITNKLRMNDISKEEININDKLITDVAEKVDTIILAWGKRGDNSKKIEERQNEILKKLEKHIEKTFYIGNREDIGFHPLAPQIRFDWILSPLFR